jgi:AcrR family transcriptional regulator
VPDEPEQGIGVTSKTFDREQKRLLLLETAAQVFAAQGFASTRVSDIASRAGVAKGTMYEYFSSKEQLFFEVFEWFNVGIRSRADEVIAAHPSPRDRLVALLRLGGEIIVGHPEHFPMMNVDLWVTSRGSALEEMFTRGVDDQYRGYRQLVANIIRDGQRAGEFHPDIDPAALGTLIVSTFDGLGLQYWLDRTLDPVGASEKFALALCRGLCPEEP